MLPANTAGLAVQGEIEKKLSSCVFLPVLPVSAIRGDPNSVLFGGDVHQLVVPENGIAGFGVDRFGAMFLCVLEFTYGNSALLHAREKVVCAYERDCARGNARGIITTTTIIAIGPHPGGIQRSESLLELAREGAR